MTKPFLIAVVGHPSTGKDTAAQYIVEKYHCSHVSLSDLLRAFINENNLGEINRDLLQQTGNMLRKERGADYLVRLGFEKVAPPAVFSGLRAVKEAETFKQKGGVIIAITCPIEVRYERAHARKGDKDQVTFEKFKAQQAFEAANEDPTKMNVEAVIRMADYTIENTGTLEDLYKKVDEIIAKIHP